jgi:hypothetical protein
MEKEINIDAVLRAMREIIGNQAQEIAILKATLEASTTN